MNLLDLFLTISRFDARSPRLYRSPSSVLLRRHSRMPLRVTEKLFMETFSSVVSLIVRDHRCVDFLCCEPEFDVCLESKETKKIRALMFPRIRLYLTAA